MRAVILLAFFSFALSGCVFIISPHTVQDTPSVRGTILDKGVPAGGVTVYLQQNARGVCEKTQFHATSDIEGKFYIPGRRRLEFAVVMGDRVTSLGVCLELNDTLHHGWRGSRKGDAPSGIRVTCNLEKINYPDFSGIEACYSEGWPNYAFKPIAEQAPGSN